MKFIVRIHAVSGNAREAFFCFLLLKPILSIEQLRSPSCYVAGQKEVATSSDVVGTCKSILPAPFET